MPSNKPLQTSEKAWAFLVKKGGLKPDLYDEGLVHELGRLLQIEIDGPDPVRAVAKGLKRGEVSVERFVIAFFRTIQPFAAMMSDLCSFFESHGVKSTNEVMPLSFDFGRGRNKLRFDLESFRRALQTWDQVVVKALVTSWTKNDFWKLHRIFSEASEAVGHVTDEETSAHVKAFSDEYSQGAWPSQLPDAPRAGEQSVDGAIDQIWSLLARLLNALRADSKDRDSLLKPLAARSWKPPYRQSGPWDEETLGSLASDHFLRSMTQHVYRWAGRIGKLPRSQRALAGAVEVGKVTTLFRDLPLITDARLDYKKILQDILDLPIWSKRHELYSAWVLTRIEEALGEYKPILHHQDGVLRFDFKATHLGTAPSEGGLLFIMSEVRTRLLRKSAGKGRTGNIQPDYRITRATLPESAVPDGAEPYDLETLAVIEVKQYYRSGHKNFVAALKDYAGSCTKARILLVNYGPAAATVASAVEPEYPERFSVHGEFRPYVPSEKSLQNAVYRGFSESLLAALPKPVPTPAKKPTVPFEERMLVQPSGPCQVVAIDVSQSMSDYLSSDAFRSRMSRLIADHRPTRILAVNTAVVRSWSVRTFRYQELSILARRGDTDLPGAFAGDNIDLSRTIVVTDAQGADQLRGHESSMQGLVLISPVGSSS